MKNIRYISSEKNGGRKIIDLEHVSRLKKKKFRLLIMISKWSKNYFIKFFSDGYGSMCSMEELEIQEDGKNWTYYSRTQVGEVEENLKRIYDGRFVPNGNPAEVWKCVGEQDIAWLTKLFNRILISQKMSNEWTSTLVPVFRNKSVIQNFENHIGKKIMYNTMKLWEKVIKHRISELYIPCTQPALVE